MCRFSVHSFAYSVTLLLSLLFQASAEAQVATPSPPAALEAVEKSAGVFLQWDNKATYDRVHLYRNGDPLVSLAGTSESYLDAGAGTGFNRYEVVAESNGALTTPVPCRALVVADRTDLIWSPFDTVGGQTDSARELYRALHVNGRRPLLVSELPDTADLHAFESLWVSLGTFPYNHILTSAEANALYNFAATPDSVLYMEGGDTWFDDPQTPLHDLFGGIPTGGGDSDLTTQLGTTDRCLIVVDADYTGEQESIDRLVPAVDSFAMFRNQIPAYDTVVLRQLNTGGYTVAASHEFGGLQPIGTDRPALMELYLDCLELSVQQPLELHTVIPAQGDPSGGDRITLYGNFSRQTEVFFDGVQAQDVIYLDRNTIEVITPAHSVADVSIRATDALGSATLEKAFAYQPTPTATASGANPFGPGNMPVVQSGTLSTNSSGLTTVNITSVNTGRAFLVFNARHNNAQPDGSMIRARIASSTTLEFVRVTNSSDVINVQWYVVEYPAGVINVQRGTIPSMNSTTINVSLTPVTALDQAFVMWSKTPAATDTSWGDNDPILMELTATNNLQLRVETSHSSHVIWWEVVEFLSASDVFVQRGVTSLTGSQGSTDVTLNTDIDPTRTFLTAGFTSPNGGSDIGERMIRGQVIDQDTIRFDRSATGDDITEIAWQVVELLDGSTVQHGSASLSSGTSTVTESLTAVDLSRATAFSGIQPDAGLSMGRTPYTGNDITGVGCATLALTNATTLSLQRNNTAANADIGWFVVEWGSGVLPPSIATLSPNNGTPLGGNAVTITGSDFTADATVTFDGIAASTTFVDANTLMVLTPAHAAGTVDVTVTSVNGSDTLTNGFTYNSPPSIASVSPTSGTPLGGDTITVTGSNFNAGTTISVDGSTLTTTFVSSSTLTAVTAAHASGAVDVSVSNGNGSDTLTNGFTYNAAPTITTIAPTSGTPLGGQTLTVSGTGFTVGTVIAIDGVNRPTTFVNSTTLTAVTAAHAPGAVDVSVSNVNGTATLSNGFTYQSPPNIISISPTNGTPLGGTSVTVTGQNFTASTTLSFDGIAAATTFVNTVTLTAVTPAHAAGAVNVVATNANGSDTQPNGFTYNNPPSIASLSPNNGAPAGGETITISGANFTADATVTFGGSSAATTFVNSTTLTVTAPAGSPGAVDVTVTNLNGPGTLAGAYTYNSPPSVTSVTPASGTPLGGDTLTISGSNFTASTTIAIDGTTLPTTFVSATALTVVSAAHAPGTVDVAATNINGSDTLTGGFTYNAPPAITTVSPANGTPLGGDTITINGTGFTADAVVAIDGTTVATTFLSATTLTAVTQAHAPGSVDVTVTNLNGSGTLTNAFTYDSPPVLVSVSPVSGSPLGGDTVTLSGTGFTASTAATIDGSAVTTTFVNATTVTVVTSAHVPGLVDVSVANVNGSDTLAASFTFLSPPAIASVSPTNGTPLGGDTLTVTGSNFTAGTTASIDGAAAATTFVNTTTLTVVTPAHAPGTVDVSVSNSNGSNTLTSAFTYDEAPVVSAVSPATGTPLGGTSVTVTGTNFTADAIVSFAGNAASTTFVNSTTLTAITPAGTPGAAAVSVTNVNGTGTLAGGYTYQDFAAITAVSPANGTPLGGDSITISGAGFVSGTAVTFGGTPATSVTFVSATTLIAVTPARASGTVDVAVANANGSDTLVGGFIYDAPPTIASVAPSSGTPLGGDSVTLTGTGFTPDAVASFDGTAATTTFVNSTTLTATTPAHAPGAVAVSVVNLNGSGALPAGFTYNEPPTVTAVSPGNGTPFGGDTITVTGTNFTADATVQVDGASATTTFVNATTLTAVTPAHAPGTVSVSVSNVNGSSSLASAFTYDAPPSITSLTPNNGPPAGGQTITLTGTGFTADASVSIDGTSATTTFVNSTTVTAVTPPHANGVVDVAISNINGSDTLVASYTYNNAPSLTSLSPSNGTPLGGTSVTVNGSAFTADAAVSFDGTAAATTFVNATTLTVVTPAHAPGTVDVTVTTVNGTDVLTAGFLYDAPPTLSSVAPVSGTPLGGDVVTLSGANFTPSTTATIDGASVPTTFVNSNTLTVTTAAHAPATVDVAVSNSNGSATLTAAYTFNAPPTIASVSPTNGSPLGGETVTVTGTNYVPGTVVTIDGTPAATTFVSSSSLQVTTPAHAPGVVDVTVSNVNGSDALLAAFTYDTPPALTSLAPTTGTPLGGATITLTGTNFTADAAVTVGGSAAATTFVNSTTLTAVTPAGTPGAVAVTVTNINGASTLPASYTYLDFATIGSVAPTSGSPLGGDSITITGTGFVPGTTVTFGGTPASVTFVNATTLVVVTPAGTAGTVDVDIANANGTDSLSGGFTYNSGPALASVAPSNGTPLGGDTITITGANFTASTTVAIDGTNVTTTFVNSTTLTAVTAAHAAGTVDVSVTNVNGSATLVGAFTFDAPPTLATISPNNGSPLGGDTLSVSGANFTPDSVVSIAGFNAITTFVSSTSLQVTTPPHIPGPADVTVTNLNGADTIASGFTYNAPPIVFSATPGSGTPLGGTIVTVTGTNFTPDATIAFGGVNAATTFVDSGTLTAVTPAGTPGSVFVSVANVNGSGGLASGYTYNDFATITAISPTSGTPLGGGLVAISGTGFDAATTVTFGGTPATSVSFVNSTNLVATTPAHAPGTVDVAISGVNGSDTLAASYTYDTVPDITSLAPNFGTPFGGDTVTVNGANFTADAVVSFDGIALTTTFVDASTLTVTTPAHAPGFIDVSVASVNGSDVFSSFLYRSPPAIASVTPGNGSPLGGDTVTVSGTDFTATTTVTFDGVASATTFVNTTTLTAITPPHAPGSVDVTVSNVNGSQTLTSGFTYDNPPSLTSISPTSGSPLGGDVVTVNGANFTATTTVAFDGLAATTTFLSSTALTATTPAHAPGIVDVVVANSNGASTLAGAYTYGMPPAVTAVIPAVGTTLGGDTVTVSGANFTADAVVSIGGSIAVTAFVDSTTLTATTPTHAAGLFDVTVNNVNGSGTLAAAYTYVEPPLLSMVAPTSGTPFGGETVTITGANFTVDATITFDGVAAATTFVDAGTLSAVSPAHAPGVVDVAVSNAIGSDTLPSAFTYNNPPTIATLNPTDGTPLGGESVTITGTGFTAGTTATVDGTAAATTLLDSMTLTIITPSHAPGVVDVTVTSENGSATLIAGFTYNNPPTLAVVTPSSGSPLGGQLLTINGSNYTPTTVVSLDGVFLATTFVDANTLTVVTPAHAPGAVDIAVTNVNGTDSLLGGFAFNGPPVLTSIAPTSGTQVGGDTITLTGTGFIGDDEVTFDGVNAATVTFVDGTTLTAVTPAHAAGFVDVTVSNANGTSTLTGGFEYLSTPTVSSVTPSVGPASGGTTVTVSGSNYVGTESVSFDGIPAVSVTFIDASTIDAVTPPHAAGSVTVAVANGSGTGSLAGGFTYEAAPSISGITPATGSPLGGMTVTIMGSGFNPGTFVTFGTLMASPTTFLDATTLQVITPAHMPGFVDVTVTNVNGSDTVIDGFLFETPPSLLSLVPIVGTSLGGDTITVFGSGFTADSVVVFGSDNAVTTFLDSNTLEAVSPPHQGGPVDVTVTNSNGSSVLPMAYTYQATLFATVVTPSSGPVAGGTTVAVIGTGFQGDETVTFDGVPATSIVFVNSGQLEVVTPAHAAGTVDVEVSGPVETALLPGGFSYLAPPTLILINPAGGDVGGGTLVSIEGTNLGSLEETTVMFGGNVAPLLSVANDQNSAFVTAPPGAPGFVDVTLSTAGGSAVVTDGFLYSSGIFRRADSNQDSQVNLADAIFNLSYLFNNGASPLCFDAADSNDDGFIDLADVIYLVSFLFAGGEEPPVPFTTFGPDPTADTLNCLN